MPVEILLMVAAVIGAAGLFFSGLAHRNKSKIVITLRGNRLRLLLTGAVMWALALLIGLGVSTIVWVTAPAVVGIATFFALEALALDFCTSRVRYVRTDRPCKRMNSTAR